MTPSPKYVGGVTWAIDLSLLLDRDSETTYLCTYVIIKADSAYGNSTGR